MNWYEIYKFIPNFHILKTNLKVQAIMCVLCDINFSKSNISVDSGKIMQIASHFLCCMGFNFSCLWFHRQEWIGPNLYIRQSDHTSDLKDRVRRSKYVSATEYVYERQYR